MNKAELIEKLKYMHLCEEQTVNALANYCLVLKWQKTVKPQFINQITEGLITLRDDTRRHMDVLSALLEKVETQQYNGF